MLAADPITGKTHAEPVTAVLVHRDSDLLNLYVDNDGRVGVIRTTARHLFYDFTTKRWTQAAQMRHGDRLEAIDGTATLIRARRLTHSAMIWDLSVARQHDFYVVDSSAAALLVHNCNAAEDGGPTLFRGMRPTDDGAPEIGPSAKTLGARPGIDIGVDENGMVRPGTGGMSVNESPTGMPEFRRPPSFGGSAADLNMYCIDACELGPGLQYAPDEGGHGFVEPAWEMPLDEYQGYLGGTQDSWSEVKP